MRFLNNYVQFKKPETKRIFMQEVDKKTGKRNTMGILEQLVEIKSQEAREEGRAEALEEGNRKVRATQEQAVKAFLTNTEFSVEKIASLVDVSVSFVEQVKKSLSK
jgi:hypothetical protein